jgi:hypothetical protein
MSTWVNVARYHLIQRFGYLVLPWAALAFGFIVSLISIAFTPAGHHAVLSSQGLVRVTNTGGRYSGSLAIMYVFFFVMGMVSIGRSLPFGLTLGVSRRSYYIGTALLAIALAVANGLGLTILQAIERATGGWGMGAYLFRVPYILNGPWYLTWLTSTVALALLFGYGMWFGIVYRRWNLGGTTAFIGAQVAVLLAAALVITWANAWTGTGHFFTALSAAGLTGLLAVATAALLAGGYATIRRVTV